MVMLLFTVTVAVFLDNFKEVAACTGDIEKTPKESAAVSKPAVIFL